MAFYGSPYSGASIQPFNLGNIPNMGDLYGSVMGELQGYGNQQAADLKQNYQNAMGTAMQSLASTGLAGTTIAPSMRMGYMRQYSDALNRLNDQLTQLKVGYQTQLGGQANQMAQQQNQFQQDLAYRYAALQQHAGGGAYGGGSGPGNQQAGRVGTRGIGALYGSGATGDVVGDIGPMSTYDPGIGGGGGAYGMPGDPYAGGVPGIVPATQGGFQGASDPYSYDPYNMSQQYQQSQDPTQASPYFVDPAGGGGFDPGNTDYSMNA